MVVGCGNSCLVWARRVDSAWGKLNDTLLLHVLLPLPSSDVVRTGASCKALRVMLSGKGAGFFWQHMFAANATLGSHAASADAWLHVLLDSARLSTYMHLFKHMPLIGGALEFRSVGEVDRLIAAAMHHQTASKEQFAGQSFVCVLRFAASEIANSRLEVARSNSLHFLLTYVPFSVQLVLTPSEHNRGMMKLRWQCCFYDVLSEDLDFVELHASGSIVLCQSAEAEGCLPRIHPFGSCTDRSDGDMSFQSLAPEIPMHGSFCQNLLKGHPLVCTLNLNLACMGSKQTVQVDDSMC